MTPPLQVMVRNVRADLGRSLASVFEAGVAVEPDEFVCLRDEAEQMVSCYRLVVSDLNRPILERLYRHAPRWLYLPARRGTYAVPVEWCEAAVMEGAQWVE